MALLKTGSVDERTTWLSTLRRYLFFVLAANLVFEVAQLPLYTIWAEGSPKAIAFAVLHCTAGDLLIALGSLIIALLCFGSSAWPVQRFNLVASVTIVLGICYTIFSEWLNISVRGTWAYSALMPVIPWINTGLSPLAQWAVIPSVGLWWARRARPWAK